MRGSQWPCGPTPLGKYLGACSPVTPTLAKFPLRQLSIMYMYSPCIRDCTMLGRPAPDSNKYWRMTPLCFGALRDFKSCWTPGKLWFKRGLCILMAYVCPFGQCVHISDVEEYFSFSGFNIYRSNAVSSFTSYLLLGLPEHRFDAWLSLNRFSCHLSINLFPLLPFASLSLLQHFSFSLLVSVNYMWERNHLQMCVAAPLARY